MNSKYIVNPNWLSKYISAAGLAIVILGLLSGQSLCAGPPVYQGYSLAFPLSYQIPSTDKYFPIVPNNTRFDVLVSISKKGKSESLKFSDSLSSQMEEYLSSILTQIEYEPAAYRGNKRSCRLPLIVTANSRSRMSEVSFPVSSDFQVADNFLFYKALRLNKFELPKIEKFPKYYCNLKRLDSLKILPYVLEKLSLDSTGNVTESQVFSTNFKGYSDQIQSASLWSEFSPLKFEGKSRASENYLLVSFLPQIQYPTREIIQSENDSLYWTERWRVLLLPDTIGIMAPPLPLEYNIVVVTVKNQKYRYLSGEIMARLKVDSLGEVSVISTNNKDPKFHRAIVSALGGVNFFPAMSFHGQPLNFSGEAKFYFKGSAKIRVEYIWLDP